MATKDKAIRLPKGMSMQKLIEKLKAQKKAGFEFQKRRHAQWDENYLLYRDKVQVNRLTQRHAVNIPLIKETIRTILPKIAEEPSVRYEERGGDLDKEIVVNEVWRQDFDNNSMELVDYVDKKQVCLYGRSYKKLNWINGEFVVELKDIHDLLLDPKGSPLDIESNRFLVEPNIMRSLEDIYVNENYDKEGIEKLKSKRGKEGDTNRQKRSEQNKKIYEAKMKRMQQLNDEDKSYEDIENINYDHSEMLTQHYTELWNAKEKRHERYVILTADDDNIILSAKSIEDTIGVSFWPFEGWADDIEATDVWSDSIADMIRTPNQVINIWLSQLIENRTLRNYGMNFFDSTVDGFEPQQYEPRPGGWYPLPGKPSEIYQRVDIPDLAGTTDEIQFLISLAEKASATGAVEKGTIEQARRTLGEIELAVGKAEERTTSMSKFYRLSWKRFAQKWYALYEANLREGQTIKLYKKNPNGQLVGREVSREDIVSEEGYQVLTNGENERTTNKLEAIQRLLAIKQEFPDNAPLQKAIQKRLIRLGDLSPEEADEIQDFEARKIVGQVGDVSAEVPGAAPTTPDTPASAAIQQVDRIIQGSSVA